jgi:tocopherol O-methyltransferase
VIDPDITKHSAVFDSAPPGCFKTEPFDDSPFKEVVNYYVHTSFDYRMAWLKSTFPAIHFGFYDLSATRHDAALDNANRVMARLAGVRAGDEALDAGCGMGGSCFWLARRMGVRVVGITPVAAQIEACRRRAAKEKGLEGQVAFYQADYCHTPFPDAAFDVIWACESLCHAERKAEFYREAYRLLRPGGRIVIMEYVRVARPLPARGEQLLADWLRRWAIPDIDSREEHMTHARGAGFRDIQVRDMSAYTWISSRNLYQMARRWFWLGVALRRLGIRSSVQHDNHRGAMRQFEALRAGCWYYAAITATKALGQPVDK